MPRRTKWSRRLLRQKYRGKTTQYVQDDKIDILSRSQGREFFRPPWMDAEWVEKVPPRHWDHPIPDKSRRNLFFYYIYWIFSCKFLVLWWFLSKLVDKGGLWSRLTGKTMRERQFFVLFQCQHIQICCVTLKKVIETRFLRVEITFTQWRKNFQRLSREKLACWRSINP